MGQRIIHILNTFTAGGQLYEVDMRLRPSGNSGLLVSSLRAFEEYQEKEAWTWEHQALVRARVIAGSEELAKRFEAVREQIIGKSRDARELADEVVKMREKCVRIWAPQKKRRSRRSTSSRTVAALWISSFWCSFLHWLIRQPIPT
ncbi:hypothetical protein [Aliamphritea spongicola]|nr:hypothetical protein [Aliamphritea spongicola]